MKFEETVLTADGVVQLFFKINFVKDQSMTKLILKNPGTNKNNQRKKQTHRHQTHTHKHRHKGKKHNTVN